MFLLVHAASHTLPKSSSMLSVLKDKTRAKHGRKSSGKACILKAVCPWIQRNILNGRSRRLSAEKELSLILKQKPGGEFTVFEEQLEQTGCKASFVLLSTHRPSTMRCLEGLKCCSVRMRLNMYI